MLNNRSERGAVAITVALTLVVLLGMVALAVDGGVVYNERRSTQNAADHAALAAAWAQCTGEDPITAGQASALANGYESVKVSITEPEDNVFRAEVTEVEDTQFGGVIGTSDVTILSDAEATCVSTPGGGGYAIFAGASTCGNEIRFNGGPNRTVNGGVHSNGDMSFSGGPGGPINGPVTYFGSLQDPQGYASHGQQLSGTAIPYPVSYDIVDYRPGGSGAGGAYFNANGATINNGWMTHPSRQYAGPGPFGGITINTSGVYYTTGSIQLHAPRMAAGVSATFVSDNNIIHITGQAQNMRPYHDGLLMFSTYPGSDSCSTNPIAIQWSMSSAIWEGVIFAPHGECRQSTAMSSTVNGSIICYHIDLHGASFTINYDNNSGGPPQYTVELRK